MNAPPVPPGGIAAVTALSEQHTASVQRGRANELRPGRELRQDRQHRDLRLLEMPEGGSFTAQTYLL